MARADYHAQLVRHLGEWDVLPHGLVVPSLPHGTDWRRGFCRGIALLTDEVLEGNRWPALSGALLAELARRCAMLGAFTAIHPRQRPRPREISVRFRKAIAIADARRHPKIAEGGRALYWSAAVDESAAGVTVGVRMTRQPPDAPDPGATLEATVLFDLVEVEAGPLSESVERRMSDYLLGLPRRLALPAYLPGWSTDEILGVCRERPGSLVAVAEQALADAGKIIRGEGVADGEEESMLLADLTYRWLEEVDDACASYSARPGPRRRDAKGRDWVLAAATLTLDGRPVGEVTGNLVFRSSRAS